MKETLTFILINNNGPLGKQTQMPQVGGRFVTVEVNSLETEHDYYYTNFVVIP